MKNITKELNTKWASKIKVYTRWNRPWLFKFVLYKYLFNLKSLLNSADLICVCYKIVVFAKHDLRANSFSYFVATVHVVLIYLTPIQDQPAIIKLWILFCLLFLSPCLHVEYCVCVSLYTMYSQVGCTLRLAVSKYCFTKVRTSLSASPIIICSRHTIYMVNQKHFKWTELLSYWKKHTFGAPCTYRGWV